MRLPAPTVAAAAGLAALLLSACGQTDGGPYPRLLPLDQLNAPPGIPAHAAEAAANPDAVGAALRARRAAIPPVRAPGADSDALQRRAEALQRRAQGIAAEPLRPAAGSASPPLTPAPAHDATAGTPPSAVQHPSSQDGAPSAERLRALRERANALQGARVLPPCPPAGSAVSADPAGTDCAPLN